MYNQGELCIFHTHVEPLSSGSRVFNDSDKIVNIRELLSKLLDGSAYVVIANDVSTWSNATIEQRFIMSDVLVAEEGYSYSFMFSHNGRSASGVTTRKIMMSFKETESGMELKATYFAS